MIILDGKKTAEKRNARLKNRIQEVMNNHVPKNEGLMDDIRLSKTARPPRLIIMQVKTGTAADAASESYIKSKIKSCESVGIEVEHQVYVNMDEYIELDCFEKYNYYLASNTEHFLEKIKFNQFCHRSGRANPNIDGIIVQLPLPSGWDVSAIEKQLGAVPRLDVDGFSVVNKGLLMNGMEGIRPATPQGILNLLDEYGLGDVTGKNVVVVGRSNIVGVPIAKMMLDRNATVTICHSKTAGLAEICSNADIIIAAVGRPEMLDADYIDIGAIVIDVGINRVVREGDSAGGSGRSKLVGDVNFEEVSGICKAITPVPGGVGPMTVNALLENVVKSWEERTNEKNRKRTPDAGN